MPLYIESLRLVGDREAAQMVVDNITPEKASENPNFLLQKGILLFDAKKYDDAKKVFESLSSMEEWPNVVEESKAYLTSIDSLETDSGSIF